MSQPWMRKVAVKPNRDSRANSRVSVPKVVEDPPSRTVKPNHENQRSQSKNKIPKNVRYDLENALVGLCDVWFEEIKPHLVRKNIKLHVHGAGADRASGDFEEVPSPANNCTHLDPGAAPDQPQPTLASCAGCCSMQPTASKAPCSKPLTAPCQHHTPSPIPLNYDQIPHPICEATQTKRPRLRRKKITPKTQSQTMWRVPRLCRTYSLIAAGAAGLPSPPPFNENYVRELFKSIFNKVSVCPAPSPNNNED
ncbi:uncharacterized protein LOC142974957 isoform X2 [Anticarsia gemmatalis]|uniref:uncharacterized protein LOC142974957 isoform X2 n=1 Tax=Anticarsia gemmatalis TaxID=129554 RepID=UPI003F772582